MNMLPSTPVSVPSTDFVLALCVLVSALCIWYVVKYVFKRDESRRAEHGPVAD